MVKLAKRLRRVHVACGDWMRVMTPQAFGKGPTGILLDPPYFDGLSDGLYAHSDANVSANVRAWAIENGDNPNLLELTNHTDTSGPFVAYADDIIRPGRPFRLVCKFKAAGVEWWVDGVKIFTPDQVGLARSSAESSERWIAAATGSSGSL